MKKAAWLVGFGSVAVVLGAACGGKVTFIEGSGSGSGGGDATSSGSTSKGSTSTGTKPTCEELRDAFVDAAFAAQACDPKLDEQQCDGSVIILDSCDCPSLVLNEDHPDLVKQAIAARAAWSGAGCPSLDCGACFEAQGGACDGQGPNGGICIGLSLN